MKNDETSDRGRREREPGASRSDQAAPADPASERSGGSEASGSAVWKEEFSIDAAEDAYVLRRQFTKFLVLTSAGMAAGNGWIWLTSLATPAAAPHPPQVIARASELAPGAVRMFSYPRPQDPCILFRRRNGVLAAFSQKCTHLSCAVNYAVARDRLECPCHDGYFSAENGRVLQGPPPRPLPRIRIEQRGDDIVAVGVEEALEP